MEHTNMKKHGKAIVLLSGGMDSLVSAAVAVRDCAQVNFLHASYGQKTQEREMRSFKALCEYYNPLQYMVLDWSWLGKMGGSKLTDMDFTKDERSPIPSTYVPFRNANLVCAAVSWAEATGSDRIYIGAVEEDSSGYPDCRESFFAAMQSAIDLGSRNDPPISIITPVIHLSKAQIVSLGVELGVPFQHSWSCYFSEDEACGECESCKLRLKAFRDAGYTDPIPYRAQGWSL